MNRPVIIQQVVVFSIVDVIYTDPAKMIVRFVLMKKGRWRSRILQQPVIFTLVMLVDATT
jgi:hypothetical protein